MSSWLNGYEQSSLKDTKKEKKVIDKYEKCDLIDNRKREKLTQNTLDASKQSLDSKPPLKLIGEDGNAFVILCKAKRAGRKANWTEGRIATFRSEAMSSDYDKLLRTCMKYFDVS